MILSCYSNAYSGPIKTLVLSFPALERRAVLPLCRRYLSQQHQQQPRLPSQLRVAIVGSGPSGCYTAKYLQSTVHKINKQQGDQFATKLRIDVIERLVTPYGLVRYGVAPDHPEVKNVQNDFDALFSNNNSIVANKDIAGDSINFYGNVQVGRDVHINELRKLYDVVVLAYGCESDRRLNIPGNNLNGVLSAREFVAWYNGHPEFEYIGEIVKHCLVKNNQNVDDDNQGSSTTSIVIIGHGNVALDCARVLAKGSSGLYTTDLAFRALQVLQQLEINDSTNRKNSVTTDINIVGRRGHVQGAYTIKELRELVKLKEEGYKAEFIVRSDELELGMTTATKEELEGPSGRPRKRIDDLLRQAATTESNVETVPSQPRRVHLRFLLNPVEFVASTSNPTELAAVRCERTRLEGPRDHQRAVGTGEFESLPAQLALVSIGYKGMCLPGLEEYFDKNRGVYINTHGRIQKATSNNSSNDNKWRKLGGLYVSGWLRRGPSGIIVTNIIDARDTVATILQDLQETQQERQQNPLHEDDSNESKEDESLQALLTERGVKAVDWNGYLRLEAAEHARRRCPEQPREKITESDEQLKVALG